MKASRREFLLTSTLGLTCSAGPLRSLVAGTSGGSAKTLVVVFLRGGADGLNLIVPFGDPNYAKLRPWIRVSDPQKDEGALDLDGFFGLHPNLIKLQPWFRKKVALALHAVGSPANTRSHFEEQDVWETGLFKETHRANGWLDRHLVQAQSSNPVRALSLGGALPRILRGDSGAIALDSLADLGLKTHGQNSESLLGHLEKAYASHPNHSSAHHQLAQSADSAVVALRKLAEVAGKPVPKSVVYPETRLGKNLEDAAHLIKAGLNLEVICVDYGGWDTHQNQGQTNGSFGQLTRQLGDALGTFCQDLEDRMDDVLLLTMSEFGRTAKQNGTGGTDHGWGSCMFLLGGAVSQAAKTKPVWGSWPGLSNEQLNQGRDLKHTTDFRDILAEVAIQHLRTPDPKTLFPAHDLNLPGILAI